MRETPWERIYVLHCWQELPVVPKGQFRLRISLNEVATDSPPVHFVTLDDLLAYLQTELDEREIKLDQTADSL
jgi:hypothetical protein